MYIIAEFHFRLLNTVWRVIITTGVYEPPEQDDAKTGSNADDNDEENAGSDYVSQKKSSSKYQIAPWAPVADLLIVIYGDHGKTGALQLMSDQPSDTEKFLPGHSDSFKVVLMLILDFTAAYLLHFIKWGFPKL